MIVVLLPGEPRGWGRVRVRVVTPRGRRPFPSFYTDAETRAYEKALGLTAKVAMKGQRPLEGPLKVTIAASIGIPASWSNKKRDAALAGIVRPTGKPDWDNFGKIGCDALNQICWVDDAQIVDARVVKAYSEFPALRIEVQPLETMLGERE